MMRALLISLAIVIAVLAFVLDQVWLYWAAGALLVAAIVIVVSRMWRRYQEAVQFRSEEQSGPRHAELSDLGILEVRPRTEGEPPDGPGSDAPVDEPVPSGGEPSEPAESAPPPELSVSEPRPDQAGAEDTDAEQAQAEVSADEAPAEPAEQPPRPEASKPLPASHPVFGPSLQALRAAVDSHTACLLVQEDVMLTYRIAAVASRSDAARVTGSFETDAPLLSAGMSQEAFTAFPVGEDGIDPALLGYYEHVPEVTHIAFAPVPTPSEAATYFLVADAVDADFHQPRAKKIITEFAELLGVLIEAEAADEAPAPAAPSPAEPEKPRPRREIIAEEMEEAQRASVPLALALVHLNRAEKLSQRGSDVVGDAESTLQARLERSAPRSRVERFGELTFGVFYNGDVVDVEPWAERLQDEMAATDGLLAGGVSIGVAMLRDETQSPEALREDATEALWMAYETGTCTIVE